MAIDNQNERSITAVNLCTASAIIGNRALEVIGEQYGCGVPATNAPPTVRDLAYHNEPHGRRTGRISAWLARLSGLEPHYVALAQMLGDSHDVVHEGDEAMSAEQRTGRWIVDAMMQFGFPDQDLNAAEITTRATTPVLDTQKRFRGQLFSYMDFPDKPTEAVARAVTAADTAPILSCDGPTICHYLYKEFQGLGYSATPEDLTPLIPFTETQIGLVEDFIPVHPEIEQLFGNLRKPLVKYNSQLLTDLQSGRIEHWHQIETRDAQFRAAHSMRQFNPNPIAS